MTQRFSVSEFSLEYLKRLPRGGENMGVLSHRLQVLSKGSSLACNFKILRITEYNQKPREQMLSVKTKRRKKKFLKGLLFPFAKSSD